MTRWFRVYDEILDDPKVQLLTPELFKTWANLLAVASRNAGKLPPTQQLAFALRLAPQDMQSKLDELILAGLIDITTDGMEPHNWTKRQWKRDDSTDRVRRHRNRKHQETDGNTLQADASNGDVTVTEPLPSRPQIPEPESETESNSLPSESGTARAKVGFRFDLKRGRAGKGSLDDLARRAEGLGLPVDDLLRTIERNRPEKPAGYFLGMCVKRLKDRLPTLEDGVLRAALNGRPTEYTLVTALLVAEMEST